MENCSTEINSTRNSSTIFTIFRSKPKQQSEASKQVWTRLRLLASTRCGAGIDDAAPSATRAAAASHGTKRQRRTKASRGRDRGCHRRLRLPEAAHRVRLRPNPYWMEAILPTVRCLCLPFAKLSQSSRHQHLSKNFFEGLPT